MTEHKWVDEIKAWALDRNCIEQRQPSSSYRDVRSWHAFQGHWIFKDGWEYRIKPEPKPDELTGFFYRSCMVTACHPNEASFLLFGDRETGKLKSVRMIGKPDPSRMEALLRKIEDADSQYFFTKAELTEALRTD